MANKLNMELRQTQNLMMTPQLQQAIKLLTLTHLEMTQMIAEEMVENPLLEEEIIGAESEKNISADADYQLKNLEHENKETTSEHYSSADIVQGGKEEFDWDSYVEAYNVNSSSPPPPSMAKMDDDDLPNYENMVTKEQTLGEYLEWQVRMQDLNERNLNLALEIIGNLNNDGYMTQPLEDIIASTGHAQDEAFEVLRIVQSLDPVGCATSDLKECLLVQAQHLNPRLPLVEMLIENHLTDLERKDYQLLSKKLGISKDKIREASEIILSLNPRPGALINSDQTHYVVPDIFIYDMGGEFVVSLNDEGVPRLRISNLYQSMLKKGDKDKNKDKGQKEKDDLAETQDYVHDKLRSAMWLIKSIQNRQKTILKVTEAILRYQPEFFRKGPKFLRPMILKDIAQEIGMHESTVSRVTVNKYVHTPIGTFELKYFFNAGIGGKNGGIDVASETLKLKIKKLVEGENSGRPLSDQKIVELLSKEDIVVARRTVAKYREMMSILPSSRRKKK